MLTLLACFGACTTGPGSADSEDNAETSSDGSDDSTSDTGSQISPQCGDGVHVPGERCWHDVETHPTGDELKIIEAFDIEADGRTDLIFGQATGVNYVSWNDADGSSTVAQVNLPRQIMAVCDDSRHLAVGSLFVVEKTGPASADADLVRLERDPDDPEQLREHSRTALENQSLSCALGDFDGDGNPEIVVSLFTGDSLTTVRVESDGMQVTQTIPVGRHPRGIRTFDIDSDGRDDVFVTLDNHFGSYGAPDSYLEPGQVAILHAGPGGELLEPSTHEVVVYPYDLDIGDLDGDGAPDIVAVGLNMGLENGQTVLLEPGEEVVTILWGDGNGGFSERLDLLGGSSARNSRIADFDGDGRLDFATSSYDAVAAKTLMQIWFADATPRGFERMDIALDQGLYFDIGDLDNDGVLDFAAMGVPSADVDFVFSNP